MGRARLIEAHGLRPARLHFGVPAVAGLWCDPFRVFSVKRAYCGIDLLCGTGRRHDREHGQQR